MSHVIVDLTLSRPMAGLTLYMPSDMFCWCPLQEDLTDGLNPTRNVHFLELCLPRTCMSNQKWSRKNAMWGLLLMRAPSPWLLYDVMGQESNSVVRALDLWSKGSWFESWQKQLENFLLQDQLSVLLFLYLFHLCVSAVACKRSWSFCQKCRWQITAKHTCTLPLWLWMHWHCKLVNGWVVYTEHAPTWQQFHVAPAMQQPNITVLKEHAMKGCSHSFRITCDKSAVSVLENGEKHCTKVINHNNDSNNVTRAGKGLMQPCWSEVWGNCWWCSLCTFAVCRWCAESQWAIDG